MLKTTSHIKNVRHILWMWFMLFALSPCVVKEALFDVANVEYAKPLNKSRAATPAGACTSFQSEKQQRSIVKQTDIHKPLGSINFLEDRYFIVRSTRINTHYSKTSSGNSPPKYILYKRLKIDAA